MLVLRRRVLDRLHADPAGGMAGAIKDEVVNLVMALASAAGVAGRSGGGSSSRDGGSISNSVSTTTGGQLFGRSGSNQYGHETIPLSTATDEEWGWEDDDYGPNLELSQVGGDDAKEEEDLALAIAMSLSESKNSGSSPVSGGEKVKGASAVPSKSGFTSATTHAKYIKSNKQTSSAMGIGRNQQQTTSPKPEYTSEASSSTGGNSIEDLLGRIGSNGGPVITSFGQLPKTAPYKPKGPAPKKEDDTNDIFASMGLSSYPSKPAGRAGGIGIPNAPVITYKPSSLSGGSQTSTAKVPESAPSPSLVADTLDEETDANWGDDEDLDDLLDD